MYATKKQCRKQTLLNIDIKVYSVRKESTVPDTVHDEITYRKIDVHCSIDC